MAVSRALISLVTLGCTFGARFHRKSTKVQEQYIRSPKTGHFQVYWPEKAQDSCNAILFAVGTSMSAKQYPDFATALTARGWLVALVDPEPGWPTKLNVKKLAASFAYGKEHMAEWTGNSCGKINTWVMGGHSAGGGTAHKVFEANPDLTDAVFSVDPFARGELGGAIPLPGLYWGFSEGSCFVDPKDSSEAGYTLSPPGKRVLAKVISSKKSYYHCSISKGCGSACNNGKIGTPDAFFTDVADSLDEFTAAVSSEDWSSLKQMARSSTETPIEWFVGDDLP